MLQSPSNTYATAIKAIKQAILQSRYKAAAAANRELLMLYFGVGEYISHNTREGQWGTNAIEAISGQLQKELPGLRGFSATNLKYMRLFYEAWSKELPAGEIRPLPTDEFHQLPTDEIQKSLNNQENSEMVNRQLATDDLPKPRNGHKNNEVIIRQLPADEIETNHQLRNFLSIGFTHHIEIINRVKSPEERLFYINQCAAEFWSIEKLRYNLKSNLYAQKGDMINNFTQSISNVDFRDKAMRSFKDEYLLDFINIEDPDEADEREIENEIVRNIRKFIMALGADFSFIGNQYRLIVGEDEFFIDLLFFNRRLQSLVAVELKRGTFKAEYLGKMNLYLSALDTYVKQPHENLSIGIVLCKEKNDTVVKFAFRDFVKPMGVATYRTAADLPEQYRNVLPDAETFKNYCNKS
jgi:predicted nuclease of restriction endonuclease-like (RecB) superfamily